MRKVIIISKCQLNMFSTTKDFENLLNDAFEQIISIDGIIIKTEYCVSSSGSLEAVIIEYEVH